MRAAGDRRARAGRSALPALRRAYCDHVVLANASQNAVIGAVVIIPGADMPAMTANQIRMVLKIAAAYGEQIGLDRALEILSVVGTAFVFRALARQALDFVPGFGWALKGAVGFTGHGGARRGRHRVFRGWGAAPGLAHAKDQSVNLNARAPGSPESCSEDWPPVR